MLAGLISGMVFGFFLKRGRFCPTGTIRDIYLENKKYNIILVLSIIFTQAFFYHLMVRIGLIYPACAGFFSLLTVGVGSLMFGIGAVMASGCITSSVIKSGDGRVVGFISIVFFLFGYYLANTGFLRPVGDTMGLKFIVSGDFVNAYSLFPIIVSGVAVIILYGLMFKHYKEHRPTILPPAEYTGLRHLLFEKIWSKEATVVLLGLLMSSGFLTSFLSGRSGGFTIGTPLLTWLGIIVPVDLSTSG